MSEVDDIVARIKLAAMDEAYWADLRALIPPLRPDAAPFDRTVRTGSARLAATAAARQGLDAGRWGTSADCPYPMGQSPAQTFLRRAWLVGFASGVAVTPRQAPRPTAHVPVELITT